MQAEPAIVQAPADAAPASEASSSKAAQAEVPAGETPWTRADVQFRQATVTRGQAVPAGEPLPAGATHEIVGHDEKGDPVLRRKRFSLH